MKLKLLILTSILCLMFSCKSHDTGISNTSTQGEYTSTKTNNKIVNSPEINNYINKIISERLQIPITSIARSDIQETTNGYYLRFLNVRTGEKYVFNADREFSSVKIIRNPKS